MDIHNNQLSLLSLLLEQVDHFLSIGRRETRGRFIEEEHSWLTYQLKGDIQALTLTTRDIFVDG